ncbi:unannotated protein [freshwater metagenome]|uniref:Unannotated protein n=1 Tax=freshwater metagenome TaxID=449393 RepID=A0A6J7ELH1_9ZZZZ
MSWYPASGLSNTARVLEYSTADSMQSRAAPIAPNTMPNRASLRQLNGPLRPRASGSIASAGRRTSSNTNSPVIDARRDSFFFTVFAVNPGVSVGTTKPLTLSSV